MNNSDENKLNLEQKEYMGYQRWYPTNDELATFYVEKTCPLKLKENEYLIICDKKDDSVLSIYKFKNGKIVDITHPSFKSVSEHGKEKTINPRNAEQRCAFDMLIDSDIKVKLITGTYGSGKTLALVTAGLQALKHRKFSKIIWIRNNIDVKDTTPLGALPGEINDKLLPFLGPFIDHAGGEKSVRRLIEDGSLVVEPLQFLRGRNLENSLIICSESENLTREHIQLIIARCAEGSEVWFDGDTIQRDKTAFEKSKGLERMIDSLKGNKLFGYVKLTKVERSAAASLADLIK